VKAIFHLLARRGAWAALIAALCTPLASCFEEETVGLSYLGVNHTNQWVVSFLINGEGGVINVPPMGGGGKTTCCVVLPKRWQPGMTVTVKWQVDGHYLKDAQGREVIRDGMKVVVEAPWQTRTVPVPEYTDKDLSHFDVHFLPNNEVQVKVSFVYPEHRDYRPAYPRQEGKKP